MTLTAAANPFKAARVTGFIEPAERGPWKIQRFTVTKADISCQLGSFYRTGRMVPPGNYTRLKKRETVVMSDTPDELRDAIDPLTGATGRVLIHGLGLGCVLKGVLAREEVTHVDVVEIDPDVIAMVGPYFAAERCAIHRGDAFTFPWPKSARWDYAWHDIWPEICTDDLEAHRRLRSMFARRCARQQSWCYELLRRMRR